MVFLLWVCVRFCFACVEGNGICLVYCAFCVIDITVLLGKCSFLLCVYGFGYICTFLLVGGRGYVISTYSTASETAARVLGEGGKIRPNGVDLVYAAAFVVSFVGLAVSGFGFGWNGVALRLFCSAGWDGYGRWIIFLGL